MSQIKSRVPMKRVFDGAVQSTKMLSQSQASKLLIFDWRSANSIALKSPAKRPFNAAAKSKIT
jgi:hypothetical protein